MIHKNRMIQWFNMGYFPSVDYIIPYGSIMSIVFIVFILKFTKVVYYCYLKNLSSKSSIRIHS
nr:MAG TPA: hypothetical protein [Caudoviricetes sp.]